MRDTAYTRLHANTYTCMHPRAHTHTHTHTHTRARARAHAHTHARTHTHTHTRTHTRTHTCTHARTHARTRTHVCTYARTHTETLNRRFPEITGKDNLTVFSYSGRVKSPEWRRQLRRADLRQFQIFRYGPVIIYTRLPAGPTIRSA